MICPKCNAVIDDDSWFCDQCGEELLFCPKCNEVRKGKRCTKCGSALVTASERYSNTTQQPQQQPVTPPQQNAPQQPLNNQTPQGNIPPQQPPQGNTPPQRPVAPPQQNTPPQSGTMRPQQQNGTMRPGNGTMRPGAATAPQIPPTEPTRLVNVSNPSIVITLKPNTLIGRTTGDLVSIFGAFPYVSGRHAQITLHSSMRWIYTDLGSTNGSTINGTPLEANKSYLLKKGQILEIGYEKFKVE